MKILFICTHNRCRSILSEAICNHLSYGRITAFSAGSQPAGEVHPLTLKYLEVRNISTKDLMSKSWNEFADQKIDVVITVCDNAANEACPVWFANTLKLHWGLPDPSTLTGSEQEVEAAFFAVMDTIEDRIKQLLLLDFDQLNQQALLEAMQVITYKS